MRFIYAIILAICFVRPCCAETAKTIGIFTYKCAQVKPWDADSIKSGIAGSEEAIIYMAQELAKLGYKVSVYANPPTNSNHTKADANPRYIPLDNDSGTHLDIAIAWRMADAAERLRKRADLVYLWPHDTFHWKTPDAMINGFQDVLWISQWQRKQWASVNPAFAKFKHIFGNGIAPDQFKPVQERANPHACIYGSNYARGLEILLNIWPDIKKQFPRATLDIYYGWQHWGLLTAEKEQKMRKQVADLVPLDVKEHGMVGHEELNRAYEKASLWTYPCTAPETFCITALRAQLAGAVPVIIEGSALPETVRYGYKTTGPAQYKDTLIKALQESEKISLADRQKMGAFILKEYTWEAIARKWKALFDDDTAKAQKGNSKSKSLAAIGVGAS